MTLAQPVSGLEARFVALWHQSLPEDDAAGSVWTLLQQRYSESVRHYHNMGHVSFCLEQLDLVYSLLRDPGSVELAVWFHDVVYTPSSPGNEAESADLFRRSATGAATTLVDSVSALILETKHVDQPTDGDACYLVDIDLASLGQPWSWFLRDTQALRREQSATADEEYHRAHAAFLGRLLARPHLYSTEFFRSRYEDRARRNIQRCLKSPAG